MKKKLYVLSLLIIATMILAACGRPAQATPEPGMVTMSQEDYDKAMAEAKEQGRQEALKEMAAATAEPTEEPAATEAPATEAPTEVIAESSSKVDPSLACVHTNLHHPNYNPSQREDLVDLMAAAHITAFRMDMVRRQYEELHGFGPWDELLAYAAKQGINTVYVTFGPWGGMEETWEGEHNVIYQDPADYEAWVKFVLEHYQHAPNDPDNPLYGLEIVIIPIMGNEPNEDKFAETSVGVYDPTHDRYLPFLQAGNKAANEVDSGLNVLVAPLSSDASSKWFQFYKDHAELYDNGSFNWYVQGNLSEGNMGPLGDALAMVGDKDLYIMEFGAYGGRHTHAQSIKTAYEMASQIPQIKVLCPHSLTETGEGFGLLDFNPDTGKICAYEAYWSMFDLFNPKDAERPDVPDCS